MRRLSLLVVAAAALTAGLIFLIWPRSAPEAEAEAEPVSPPVAAEPSAPGAAQPQPAALAPAQAAAPAAPDAPVAVVDGLPNRPGPLAGSKARLTPHDLSLYARFQRMGVAAPPETKTLIDRRKAGATVADMEAYVREAFPKDARVRVVATQWIRSAPQVAAAARR
jgi:hypothetical protein